jgi:hypothetical protein
VVSEQIRGQHVSDLGAGDLVGSLELVELGARMVSAFDRNPMPDPPHPKIQPDIRHRPYSQLARWGGDDPESMDHYFGRVAVLCWPAPNLGDWGTWGASEGSEARALVALLNRFQTVIYLGKNTDGTACGQPELFEYLSKREVLVHLPERRNTLIVYGPNVVDRPPLGEEIAGMGPYMTYDQSMAAEDRVHRAWERRYGSR